MLKILTTLALLSSIGTASAGELTKAEREEAFSFGSQSAAISLCPDTVAISNVVERNRLVAKMVATETDPAWGAASAEGARSMNTMHQSFGETACGFAVGVPNAFIDLKYREFP